MYGFDIILDEDFNPWLLEVNLSPACSERTPWLTGMLDSMATGLFDIVLGGAKDATLPLYEPGCDAPIAPPTSNNNEWIYLYRSELAPAGEQIATNYKMLEVVGEKINVAKEKKWGRRWLLTKATILLQRNVRGFLARNRQLFILKDTMARVA
jgi:hypothetical protein